jgi:Ca2+-binding RTX toxin-like protein
LGVLAVFGDNLDNTIEVSRDVAGTIRVNGGAVPVLGGTPTVANTALMRIFGLGGSDQLSLDETNGALPRVNIFGGTGNDTLIGGSGADMLFGQSGNDMLFGRGGGDFLFGGSNNDALTGGDGDDLVFGESGNDRMIWNPGDDTDLNEGGADIDTVEVNGGNGAEDFTVTANGTRVRFDRVNPAPFALDIGTTENLVLNANGGNDTFSATGNLAALIQLTVDGGAGDDTINGGNGADVLLGGDGNDLIDGNQGADAAFLGAGDDVFRWDPGDGSDVVEGQDGTDTMLFNGSGANETFDVSPNGERVRFSRNVGNIVMDLNDVESIDLNALGGADTTTVNDLSGTDVTEVNLGLSAGGGDAQPDNVIINGTNGGDVVLVVGDSSGASVLGLAARVNVAGAESANDRLTINALAGDDVVEASGLAAGAIQLTANGGDDEDVLIGGDGNDVLLGGAGDDVLLGGPGLDILDGGPGDNIVIQG